MVDFRKSTKGGFAKTAPLGGRKRKATKRTSVKSSPPSTSLSAKSTKAAAPAKSAPVPSKEIQVRSPDTIPRLQTEQRQAGVSSVLGAIDAAKGGLPNQPTQDRPVDFASSGQVFDEQGNVVGGNIGIPELALDVGSIGAGIMGLAKAALKAGSAAAKKAGGVIGDKGGGFWGRGTSAVDDIPTAYPKVNTKNAKLGASIVKKALGIGAGTIAGAWLGSVILGWWGSAEAPEPPKFQKSDLTWQARQTGNWDLVDENLKVERDAFNRIKENKAWLATPFSAFFGIANKIEAAEGALDVYEKYIEIERNMESPEQKELRIAAEKNTMYAASAEKIDAMKRATIDYQQAAYAASRESQYAAEKQILQEEADFWLNHKKKIIALEAQEREDIAQFWLDYRKLTMQMQEDSRPSNLKFGLL